MGIFSIAICDDEPAACHQITQIIQKHKNSQNFLVKKFYSGKELCDYIKENKFDFDLIILDICLKDSNGVEVGKFLNNSERNKSQILYISSYRSYAMQLFQLQPLDFLTKPISAENLLANIDDAIKISNSNSRCFTYKFEKVYHKIYYQNILYFESKAKKINIHCVDKKILVTIMIQ